MDFMSITFLFGLIPALLFLLLPLFSLSNEQYDDEAALLH